MASKYSVKSKEFGRGRAYTKRFSTLEKAQKYIQEQWQGADYKDGEASFHTDYCTFTLHGFKLADIVKFTPIFDQFWDYRGVAQREFGGWREEWLNLAGDQVVEPVGIAPWEEGYQELASSNP